MSSSVKMSSLVCLLLRPRPSPLAAAPFTPIGHFLNESQSDKHMAHTLPHPAGIVQVPCLLPQLHFHSHSVPVPPWTSRVGPGSSTWPVLWRRPVALAGKLQLIPKLRMKSNCSLAHSVVLRSFVLLLHPVQCLFVCSVVLFCFYILLTADYSSCSPHRCWERRERAPQPSPPQQPYKSTVHDIYLASKFYFLNVAIP